MYHKLIDTNSGNLICSSDICSATKLRIANLFVDPIKISPKDEIIDTGNDVIFDEFMSFTDFETPLSQLDWQDPVDTVPVITKSKI